MTVDSKTADTDQLREIAERGAAELDGASAEELLRWTDETFGGFVGAGGRSGYVVASNMQDAVLVDLAAKVRPGKAASDAFSSSISASADAVSSAS